MGLFDELSSMAGAIEKAASEHPDQVKQALGKLESVIDEQTGGSHHDQIQSAAAKAEAYLDQKKAQ